MCSSSSSSAPRFIAFSAVLTSASSRRVSASLVSDSLDAVSRRLAAPCSPSYAVRRSASCRSNYVVALKLLTVSSTACLWLSSSCLLLSVMTSRAHIWAASLMS